MAEIDQLRDAVASATSRVEDRRAAWRAASRRSIDLADSSNRGARDRADAAEAQAYRDLQAAFDDAARARGALRRFESEAPPAAAGGGSLPRAASGTGASASGSA